jgi:hypothetical protein
MGAIARHYQPAIAVATDLPKGFSRLFVSSLALAMLPGIAEEGSGISEYIAVGSETLSWTWD